MSTATTPETKSKRTTSPRHSKQRYLPRYEHSLTVSEADALMTMAIGMMAYQDRNPRKRILALKVREKLVRAVAKLDAGLKYQTGQGW